MDMKIALLHNHYDKNHLEQVKNEMSKLGPPTIKVLDLEFDNIYQALEGSHRLRAAEILGITPEFEFVDPDDTAGELELDWDNKDDRADEIGDWENYQIAIQDDEIVINAAQYMSRAELKKYLLDNDYDEDEISEMNESELKESVNDEMES